MVENAVNLAEDTVDLLVAAQSGSVSAVQYVIDNTPEQTLVATNLAFTSTVEAIFRGSQGLLEVLTSKIPSFDVNKQSYDGMTPLMFASLFNQYKAVQYLLKSKSADYTLQNKDGDTALSLAKKKGFKNIVLLLQENGATF